MEGVIHVMSLPSTSSYALVHPALAAVTAYHQSSVWTFTNVIGILAIVIAVIGVTAQQFLPIHLARRLYYSMEVAAPLLTAPSGAQPLDLRVLHGAQILKNPCFCEVSIKMQGQGELTSRDFDQDMPIRLRVGAPIISLLQVSFEPTREPVPKVKIEGDAIEIGPSLIRKREAMHFSVLADGAKPQIKCENPVIGVQEQQKESNRGRQYRQGMFQKVVSWTVIILLAIWLVSDPSGAASDLNGWVTGISEFFRHL